MNNILSNPYYRLLNIPLECCDFKSLEFELSQGKTLYRNDHWKKPNWSYKTPVIFNSYQDWLWNCFECELANIEVFYTAPNSIRPWHIDMNPPADYVKINYIWGDTDGSEMQFGEPITDKTLVTEKTSVGTPYVPYSTNEVEFKTSIHITKPILANIGRPHRVVNHSSTGRWCLCLVLWKDKNRLLFPQALELFNEYVLDSK